MSPVQSTFKWDGAGVGGVGVGNDMPCEVQAKRYEPMENIPVLTLLVISSYSLQYEGPDTS